MKAALGGFGRGLLCGLLAYALTILFLYLLVNWAVPCPSSAVC